MAELTVEICTHHFVCKNITPRARPAIESFARRFIHYGLVRENGRYFRAPLKVFAAATNKRTEYRFHINSLQEFKQHILLSEYLLVDGLVEWAAKPIPESVSVELKMFDFWQMRENQVPAVDYILSKDPPLSKFVELQTGQGKATTLDTRIKTPGGWTTMGEVSVGTVITAPDGKPTTITAVYPQGEKEIYRITFFDGRTVECCDEHQWRVFVSSSPSYWKVMTTKEIRELGRFENKRCYVQLIEPEDGPDQELPIDPYVLGVILGDAHVGHGCIVLSNPEEFIIDKVSSRLPDGMLLRNLNRDIAHSFKSISGGVGKNHYLNVLRELGLTGKLSYQKTVPEIYLHGSKQQRLDLLQGLMDTDGYACVSGAASFTSTSFELAKTVQYLVRSLGGIAGIVEKNKFFTYNGERKPGRTSYNVNIRHKHPSELFSLPRKKERLDDDNQYAPTIKLRIDEIESIGKKPAQCITVDHPSHLFVVNDFAVTHNSVISMKSASVIGKRYCLIVRPAYIEKWILDLEKTFEGSIKEHVLVVQGSAQLMRLLQMAETGELDDIKVIVFSNKTLQNWFKLYEQHGEHLTSLGYACMPHQLCEFLGIGFRVIDEVHQDFHLNFKIDLYTHVARSVSLSATLISADDFINNMYELAYPSTQRYKGGAYDKYIEARAVLYRLSEPNKVRTTEYGSKTYSHHAFEKSVMRNPVILRNYLALISQVIRGTYLNNYKPGDRLLVYGASIDFCTRLTAHLKQQHPTLRVNRYVESDPYDNLMESDICVSTMQSAGTGVDILGLTTVILTPAVKSSAANIQGFGRLRKLKDGTVPQFLYFVCQDIKKHVEYHASKRELLASRAAVYREEYMNSSV